MTEPIDHWLPADILSDYECHNYRSAAQVLATRCAGELNELVEALRAFKLQMEDIQKPGGNKSRIPGYFTSLLGHQGWLETRIKGDLVITKVAGEIKKAKKRKRKSSDEGAEDQADEESESETLEAIEELAQSGQAQRITRKNFLDGHKVDFVKNRVAFDLEWNSKDQTFDRDLYAFRAFHECNLIDVGIIITRSKLLDPVFAKLPQLDKDGNRKLDKDKNPKPLKTKYGASTTWMGKLTYRIEAGRNGGCPVLAIGITPKQIIGWEEYERENP